MITLTIDNQPEITVLMKTMLQNIDPKGEHMTATSVNEAIDLLSDRVQIVFLDIEMPGINGIDAAKHFQEKYDRLNVIFVTGHIEYSFAAHGVHPSGFLVKPVDEQDIRRELRHLRYPVSEMSLCVSCDPFTVRSSEKQIVFKGDKTEELFAYLVYKNGAFCTNDELITVLWGGESDRSGRLRQIIMNLKSTLSTVSTDILVRKYGKTSIDMNRIEVKGELSFIKLHYNWI